MRDVRNVTGMRGVRSVRGEGGGVGFLEFVVRRLWVLGEVCWMLSTGLLEHWDVGMLGC